MSPLVVPLFSIAKANIHFTYDTDDYVQSIPSSPSLTSSDLLNYYNSIT